MNELPEHDAIALAGKCDDLLRNSRSPDTIGFRALDMAKRIDRAVCGRPKDVSLSKVVAGALIEFAKGEIERENKINAEGEAMALRAAVKRVAMAAVREAQKESERYRDPTFDDPLLTKASFDELMRRGSGRGI